MSLRDDMEKIKTEGLPPVLVVLGTEDYLNQQIRQALVDQVFPDGTSNEFNTGVFDMETTPVSEALIEAESIPFFDDHRMVIIDHPYFLTGSSPKAKIDHDEESLIAYLQEPAPTTYLVIFAPYEKLDGRKKVSKQLKKSAVFLETNPANVGDPQDYIRHYLAKDGYSMTKSAEERLVQQTGGDLTAMIQELEKLKIYRVDQKTIEEENVQALVSKRLDANIFDLNDHVLNRRPTQALSLFKDLLLQGQEPIQLIGLMASQFRLLLQVKILRNKGYQQGDMAKALSVHPYRIKLAQQQNHRFSEENLAQAHRGLIEADYNIKTGQVDGNLAFELFVLSFVQKFQ